jgi:hypothetical protein
MLLLVGTTAPCSRLLAVLNGRQQAWDALRHACNCPQMIWYDYILGHPGALQREQRGRAVNTNSSTPHRVNTPAGHCTRPERPSIS